MESFQKEVIDRLGRIETKLDADFRALHGNGQPGLIQKHEKLDDRVQKIETMYKTWCGILTGVLAVISIIIAFFKK